MTAELRRRGSSVGVLTVDPTSPFSGGAVLGDRLRMQGHAADEGVFIRSMATRGHLGGLARATGDAALVLDAAGKDVIVIETVGVGQDEVDIIRTADVSIVTLVPGTGDDVQALKAGIMEIADIFVVNKADREGADRHRRGDRIESVAAVVRGRRLAAADSEDDGDDRQRCAGTGGRRSRSSASQAAPAAAERRRRSAASIACGNSSRSASSSASSGDAEAGRARRDGRTGRGARNRSVYRSRRAAGTRTDQGGGAVT